MRCIKNYRRHCRLPSAADMLVLLSEIRYRGQCGGRSLLEYVYFYLQDTKSHFQFVMQGSYPNMKAVNDAQDRSTRKEWSLGDLHLFFSRWE